MTYTEWDFDNDIVTVYERHGECNGCGACCATVIRFATNNRGLGQPNPISGWDPRNGEFSSISHSGVVNEVQVGGRRRFFMNIEITDEPYRCSMLTADNRCMIHVGKHLLSREWPLSPKQVTPFPECSYTFEILGQWKISEIGAPDVK